MHYSKTDVLEVIVSTLEEEVDNLTFRMEAVEEQLNDLAEKHIRLLKESQIIKRKSGIKTSGRNIPPVMTSGRKR